MDYTKHLSKTATWLILAATLSACAGPGIETVRVSRADMRTFREDCKNKNSQLAFLRAQKRYNDPWKIHAVAVNGENTRGENNADWTDAMIDRHIKSLEYWCPKS